MPRMQPYTGMPRPLARWHLVHQPNSSGPSTHSRAPKASSADDDAQAGLICNPEGDGDRISPTRDEYVAILTEMIEAGTFTPDDGLEAFLDIFFFDDIMDFSLYSLILFRRDKVEQSKFRRKRRRQE